MSNLASTSSDGGPGSKSGMKSTVQSPGLAEKERIRVEISDQVREFLLKGGEINVLDNYSRGSSNKVGEVWQTMHDEPWLE